MLQVVKTAAQKLNEVFVKYLVLHTVFFANLHFSANVLQNL